MAERKRTRAVSSCASTLLLTVTCGASSLHQEPRRRRVPGMTEKTQLSCSVVVEKWKCCPCSVQGVGLHDL